MIIEQVETAIGYTFKDKKLLERALTLSSADRYNNNELLEFFGDAILEFIVSERIFPEGGSEGSLTERRRALVCDTALIPVSEKLGLAEQLVMGKSDTNNKKAVPSAYEAVCAAIYLDGGLEEAKKFVYSTIDFESGKPIRNYKGELQEILQSLSKHVPVYERVKMGTAQAPKFIAKVKVFGKTFKGYGENTKSAEQQAAKNAVEYYNQNSDNIKA